MSDNRNLPPFSTPLRDNSLSPRELEILLYVSLGFSNKQIARVTSGSPITEATVKVHVKAILRKVSVQRRSAAALWLHENAEKLRQAGVTFPDISPIAKEYIDRLSLSAGSDPEAPLPHFSPREKEILDQLIIGAPTNGIIGERLGITEATVKVHLKSLIRKANLAIQNRTGLAMWWYQMNKDKSAAPDTTDETATETTITPAPEPAVTQEPVTAPLSTIDDLIPLLALESAGRLLDAIINATDKVRPEMIAAINQALGAASPLADDQKIAAILDFLTPLSALSEDYKPLFPDLIHDPARLEGRIADLQRRMETAQDETRNDLEVELRVNELRRERPTIDNEVMFQMAHGRTVEQTRVNLGITLTETSGIVKEIGNQFLIAGMEALTRSMRFIKKPSSNAQMDFLAASFEALHRERRIEADIDNIYRARNTAKPVNFQDLTDENRHRHLLTIAAYGNLITRDQRLGTESITAPDVVALHIRETEDQARMRLMVAIEWGKGAIRNTNG